MNHRNPYTGTRLKDEPTVAFVNFFNEQDFRLADKTALKRFQKPFREWLRKKYRTESALAKAWGRPLNWEEAGRIDEAVLRRGDAAARDTGDFLIGTMREMTEWYFRTLREAGYPGLFQHWDMIMRTMEVPARSLMPVIAQHTYFAHPNKLPTRNLVPKCQGGALSGRAGCRYHRLTGEFIEFQLLPFCGDRAFPRPSVSHYRVFAQCLQSLPA
ncbi:MAG: beta-galactosidase [Lentisphaeria bacterium]|nr:MAG: beta-galactosidase [Lentisphaeria bacterium]